MYYLEIVISSCKLRLRLYLHIIYMNYNTEARHDLRYVFLEIVIEWEMVHSHCLQTVQRVEDGGRNGADGIAWKNPEVMCNS
jgi:hypothetical protein